MLTTTVEAGAELSPTALSLSQGGSPFTVGTFEELQRTFHAEEVATFAEVSHQVGASRDSDDRCVHQVSGDSNPVHTDADFAATTRFGVRHTYASVAFRLRT